MDTSSRPPSLRKCVLMACLFSVLFFLLRGYRFGGGTAWEVPLIKRILNPELFRSDYALETGYPVSLFWQAIGLLARVSRISLQYLYLLGYVVCIFASWFWLYRLAALICPYEPAVVVCLTLVLYPRHLPASAKLLLPTFQPKSAALPLLLFAFYKLLKARPLPACFLFGLAFLLHPLSALHALVMAFFYVLLCWRELPRKEVIYGALVLGAVAAPLVIWSMMGWLSTNQPPVGDSNIFLQVMKARFSYHVFPFSWGWLPFFNVLFLPGLGLLSFKVFPPRPLDRRVLYLCVGIVVMVVVGTIFTEMLPVPFVLLLQFFRSSKYLLLFGAFYAGCLITRLLEGHLGSRLLGAVLLAAAFFGDVPLALLSLATLALSRPWRASALLRGARWLVLPAVVALVLIASLHGDSGALQPFALRWNRLSAAMVCLLFAGLWTWLAPNARLVSWQQWKVRAPALALVAAVVIARFIAGAGVPVSLSGLPEDGDWLDVQSWAKKNTPTDVRFLVPPYLEGFRVYSERSIVVSWKDAVFLFAPGSGRLAPEWAARMRDVSGIRIEDERLNKCAYKLMKQGYNEHDQHKFLSLAQKYGAAYIVTEKPKTLSLPVAYQNRSFAVYTSAGDTSAD